MRLLHIIAGLSGLVSGAVALSALKGSKLHRQSGMLFVYAMLVISASGAVMAALTSRMSSVIAGVLTFYLVSTALGTVRRPVAGFHWIDLGAMLVALTLGIAGVQFGFEALDGATGKKDGQPAALYFIFGAVALLATLLDLRMMLTGSLEGAHRIARHLWRMCFALFIAAGQALGQAQLFPKPARNFALLAISVLVLSVMSYWLARVLFLQRHPRADPSAFA